MRHSTATITDQTQSTPGRPGATSRKTASASRTFAELLAEAEAVQDRVEVHGHPSTPGLAGRVQGAFLGALDTLMRTAPGWSLHGWEAAERRKRASTRSGGGENRTGRVET